MPTVAQSDPSETNSQGGKMQMSSSLADFTARLEVGPSGLEDAKVAVAAAAESQAATLDLQQLSLTDEDMAVLVPLLQPLGAHVRELNLFLNDIATLPSGLGAALPRLLKLLAGANPLSAIADDAFVGLTELEELDIGFGEELPAIPASIGKCTSLRLLYAGNCRIEALPEELFSCGNLEELHVYGNSLAVIPASVGKLGRLRLISAGRNQIKELPAELAECKALEALHVYENELSRFPAGLETLPALKIVNADNNLDLPAVPRDVRVQCIAQKVAAFYASV
jgi:Leucine-rich repeat (LRR) protein